MDPALERVDASLMEDSTQNSFPYLKLKIHGLVGGAFEHFVKSGPESVAAFLKEDSTQNTIAWLDSRIRPLVGEAFEHFVKSGPESVAAFLKEDSTQNTIAWLDSKIRTLVGEAFEHFLKSGPESSVNRREQIQERDGRILRLRCQTSMPRHFFVGKVEARAICVKLIEATTTTATDDVVASGAVSSMTLDVVVLDSDFGKEDHHDWTWEHFESKRELSRKGKGPLLVGREGKGPLLDGHLQVPLKGGVGSLVGFKFTDISTCRRSGKFRLGFKVQSGFYEGNRVREAITSPFKVIHSKRKSKEKHVPRQLHDDVCKLMGIGEDGTFHENLNKVGIFTVEDFLWKRSFDSEGLKEIVAKTMSGKKWKTLGDHAKESVPSGKYHVYCADDMERSGVVFKNMSELCGLIEDGKYYSAETLSDGQKLLVDTLKKKASDNWKHIVEYDDRMLKQLDMNQSAAPSELVFVNPGPAAGDDFRNQTVAGGLHGFLGLKDVRMECGSLGSVLSENYEFESRTSFSSIRDMVSVPSGKSRIDPAKESALKKVAGDKGKAIEEYVGLLQSEMTPSKRARSSQTDVVTGAPESCPHGIDLASLSDVGPPVNPGQDIRAPVPCQPPPDPSGEACENSMLDFEDPSFGFSLDNDSTDWISSLLPEADENPSLDALWGEADENRVFSAGGYGDSFEQGKQLGGSNSPRNEEWMEYGGDFTMGSWIPICGGEGWGGRWGGRHRRRRRGRRRWRQRGWGRWQWRGFSAFRIWRALH